MTDETRDRGSRGGYGQPRDVDWTEEEEEDSGPQPVEDPPEPVSERDRLEPVPPPQRPRDDHHDVVEGC